MASSMASTELASSMASTELDSSGDSMDTGTSSKINKSRPESQRGPKRNQRKMDRAQQHYETHGKPWIDKAQRQEHTAEVATGLKGSIATATHKHIVASAKKQELHDNDDKVKEALIKEIPEDMERWVKMKDEKPYCYLCKKEATESHMKSGAHIKRVEEDCLGTVICGHADTARRFNGDMCRGAPTKKMIREFWGDAIENLPLATQKIHQQKGQFFINNKEPIYPEDAEYTLGIVSYTGSGKYDSSTYVAYHELPDSEEVATAEELKRTSPYGQGWWPVIALKSEPKQKPTQVLLICLYQLLSNGVGVAWWVNIEVAE